MANSLFDGTQPISYIWVSADVQAGGDGTKDKPYAKIQQAVNKAVPGTAIMVEAGTYHENVLLPRSVSGTASAPIWLVSADGPQKAHIVAPSADGLGVITAGGAEHLVIQGFWITGGTNGIQVSQNGLDYTDMIKNIVIRDNYVENTVKDGIKVNGGENVTVTNNVTHHTGDEGIDFLGIVHGVISNNEVSGNTGPTGILTKGGSDDVLISGNYIHDVSADGIDVGGWTSEKVGYRPGYDRFEAKDVTVIGNRVESVGKRPVATLGAVDSSITGNYLQATDHYYTVINVGSSDPHSATVFQSNGISITNNIITRDNNQLNIDPGSTGVSFAGSAVANIWSGLTGANLSSNYTVTPTAPVTSAPVTTAPDTSAPVITAPAILTSPPPSETVLKSVWAVSAAAIHTVTMGTGTDAADLIKGMAGTLAGGAGDDTYLYKGVGTIVEQAGGGIDTVQASGRYFALTPNVENLQLISTSAAVLVGNSGDNAITGNAGADILVSGGGQDLLTGNGGDDMFLVSATDRLTRIADFTHGDLISIAGNPFATFADLQAAMHQIGSDAVLALGGDRYLILNNVVGSSLSATAFDFASGNMIQSGGTDGTRIYVTDTTHIATGTAASEVLYGKGDSVLIGGDGNDRYMIVGNDHIVEHPGGGVDKAMVFSGSYTMDANVENATIRSTTGTTVIGNNLANAITGGDGADTIHGGVGADLVTGGKGADSFVFDQLADGGDTITDFTTGVDKIDLRPIAAVNPGLTVSYADSAHDLMVYADHGGHHDLIATLAGVHTPLPSGDVLL